MKKIVTVSLSALIMMAVPVLSDAQVSAKRQIPLHIEIGLGAGTAKNDVTPFNANIDLNYSLTNRLSLHGLSETSYFVPREGATSKYNKATNLGGGLGYTLLTNKDINLGNLEARESVTTSVGSSAFKNTSYNIGLYLYGQQTSHKIVPIIGAGFSLKDFSARDLDSYKGLYFSIGLRF